MVGFIGRNCDVVRFVSAPPDVRGFIGKGSSRPEYCLFGVPSPESVVVSQFVACFLLAVVPSPEVCFPLIPSVCLRYLFLVSYICRKVIPWFVFGFLGFSPDHERDWQGLAGITGPVG